ncbi:MAG: TonB family protein [Flavobacteriales bacterium]|nr:TonB family protein [Flavobacteriales bacterium]
MRKELELLELVDRYLNGGLNDAERAAFEQRLTDNADLRAMLEDQRVLREGIARAALRPAVTKAYRAHRFGKWKPWLGGAFMVVIAVVGIDLWKRTSFEAPQETEQKEITDTVPIANEPADGQPRTTRYEVDTIVDTVYKVFRNGRWETTPNPMRESEAQADTAAAVILQDEHGTVRSTTPSKTESTMAVAPTETRPEFPGGMAAFYAFLEANIRHPDLEKPVNGAVEVGFTINPDGRVVDAAIVKGLNEAYNAEALRVIRSMPRWKPGTANGKSVPCRLQMPMEFRNPGAGSDSPEVK